MSALSTGYAIINIVISGRAPFLKEGRCDIERPDPCGVRVSLNRETTVISDFINRSFFQFSSRGDTNPCSGGVDNTIHLPQSFFQSYDVSEKVDCLDTALLPISAIKKTANAPTTLRAEKAETIQRKGVP